MNDLVQRLCCGDHAVEVGLRPEKTAMAFKSCIDDGYVHIRFTGTRGGTELGVTLDREACDFSRADFDASAGEARVSGLLTLDYVDVRCIADIDLATLSGRGRLERIKNAIDEIDTTH